MRSAWVVDCIEGPRAQHNFLGSLPLVLARVHTPVTSYITHHNTRSTLEIGISELETHSHERKIGKLCTL